MSSSSRQVQHVPYGNDDEYRKIFTNSIEFGSSVTAVDMGSSRTLNQVTDDLHMMSKKFGCVLLQGSSNKNGKKPSCGIFNCNKQSSDNCKFSLVVKTYHKSSDHRELNRNIKRNIKIDISKYAHNHPVKLSINDHAKHVKFETPADISTVPRDIVTGTTSHTSLSSQQLSQQSPHNSSRASSIHSGIQLKNQQSKY